MLTSRSNGGFTMVEVIVALVILSAAVLGLAASASSLTTNASRAELRTMALYSVTHRIAIIELDMRYAALDSLYAATAS
jgi:prepilin-type N-terminal cleavage/methylation domain-containing protein